MANTLIPDIFGIPGDLVILTIFIIITIVMAALIVRFLNQSIELAVQLEKEMEYSKDLETRTDGLEQDLGMRKDREKTYLQYVKDAQDAMASWGQPSQEYGDDIATRGDYGEVEVVQHYEQLPSDILRSKEVEVTASASKAEEKKVEKVVAEVEPERKLKKKAPVVAKAKVVSVDVPVPGKEELEFQIQDVFVIYKDGRLVSHLSNKLRIIDDSEIIGSMITAVQMCVMESFKRESSGTLDEMKFGNLRILMESGDYLNLAVVLRGTKYKGLKRVLRDTLKNIHKAWGKELKEWDGTLSHIGALEKIIQKDLLDRFEVETFHKGDGKTFDPLSKAGIFRPE